MLSDPDTHNWNSLSLVLNEKKLKKSCVVTGKRVNAFKAVFKFSSLHYRLMTVNRRVFAGNVNVLPGKSC